MRCSHGVGRGETQPVGSSLLQSGCDERREGTASVGLDRHVRDFGLLTLQVFAETASGGFVQHCQAGGAVARLLRFGQLAFVVEIFADRDPFAVKLGNRSFENAACRALTRRDFAISCQSCFHAPISCRDELHSLALPLHHDAHGHALHTPCRQLGPDLFPKHGRDFKPVETIQHSSGFLGFYQTDVYIAGFFNSVADGRLGYLVEHHALDFHIGGRRKLFQQMPSDGLAFSVFVGGQIDPIHAARQLLEAVDVLALVFVDHIDGFEVVVHIYAEARPRLAFVAGRYFGCGLGQVADMTDGRLHDVVVAQVARDGAGLGRGFDDYQC